jgi:hypothetical protein
VNAGSSGVESGRHKGLRTRLDMETESEQGGDIDL